MAIQVATPKHRADASTRSGPRQRGRHVSSYGDGFGRFATITALALIPGAGLLVTGRRRVGTLLLLLTALVLAVLVVTATSGDIVQRALALAVQPTRLLALAVLTLAVAAVWCLTIVLTAWRARPERPSPLQAVAGTALVAALCLAVATPTTMGARLAFVQRDLVSSVFSGKSGPPQVAGAARPQKEGSDPWRGVPRVNLLLLGSDAGADRTGVRTDSMIVASIDTKTGNTVLIGLPRNLQRVPFPTSNPLNAVWPNGFDCGSECLLNAVWDQAANVRPDLFPGNKNPGLTTTRDVIGEVLGLRIDAYMTVDLRGFQSLVDAMGGVTVNVPRDIPIGGGKNQRTGGQLPIYGYIRAGQRHLNGYEALWFARSREGSDDYDRMRRQRCMVGSLVTQVNPVKLLAKYPELAAVLQKNISTDVQQDQLQAWVVLVQRIQKAKITSLPLTSSVINTINPDFEQIRHFVRNAVEPPQKTTAPTTPGSPPPSTPSSPPPTTDSRTAQDIRAVC